MGMMAIWVEGGGGLQETKGLDYRVWETEKKNLSSTGAGGGP